MRTIQLFVLGILAAVGLACHDLDVTNPNNPDREVVAHSPSDVETLISTSFRRWFNRSQLTTPSMSLATMADELTSGFFDFGTQETSREPREPIQNDPLAANPPHMSPFSTYYSVIAGVNTGIQAIRQRGLKIMAGNTDVTPRALAFGKFVQGLTHGYIAILYDQGWVHGDAVDSDTLRFGGGSRQVHDLIRPYTEVRDSAIAQLNDAVKLATDNSFTLPGDASAEWVPGVTMTNQKFAQLIHSYIARIMVNSARTPAERAAVDWTTVISHIDQGITEDFAPSGTPSILQSTYKQYSARQRTTTPGDFARVDYMLIGPADLSDNFITWYNKPWSDRTPFQITTTDNRIGTGANKGTYIGYHVANIFAADRGTAQRSYYYFHRLGTSTSWQNGAILVMTVAEMDLLKAEGLIRLGRANEAIPLINKTRVANGGLPPVTIDGVPGDPTNCIPRKLNGSCGSLWDALRYEKRIEGLGVDAAVTFADMRGWGGLVVNTPLHFPFPGNQLQLLQTPLYTVGGGLEGSAAPPNPEKCPTALPRCP